MGKYKLKIENPIKELIDDKTYTLLNNYSMLDELGIRNYQVKKMFKEMRDNNISKSIAFDKIYEKFSLSDDSIKKIVYAPSKNLIFNTNAVQLKGG
jgi:hypothetical protein